MIKVGDRFKSNRGQWMTVVEVKNQDNILIEFEDDHRHRKWIDSVQVKGKGDVKNPFFPLLFGVGYFGVGPHKSKAGSSSKGFANLPVYSNWTNMLSRCYDPNYKCRSLYEHSEVTRDWHNFQVYAEWYNSELESVKWEGVINVDKDIVGNGFLYSPETCCLVPLRVNTSVMQNLGGKYLPGVRKVGKTYRVIPNYDTSHMLFSNELDAHLAFVESKSRRIIEVANEYKEKIKPIVYETLCTKDFRYKFSPLFEKPKTAIY